MTLTATDVAITYAGNEVFTNVSMAIERGEVLTVVGPSGAGKTSFLRLLAAFRQPDAGTIAWNGTDIWDRSRRDRLDVRRRVSMVFQEPGLFNASVVRNVTYGQRVRLPWSERVRRAVGALAGGDPVTDAVEDALKTVGLADKHDQNVLSLSGGEAQRVSFARALAVDPDVMLLDEPTSNLDPRNTAVLENAISRARDRGVGVVVATHDMHQAERISDRVAFLFDGDVVETGPPEQVFEDPADPRTARFVDGDLLYDPDEATAARERGSSSLSPTD